MNTSGEPLSNLPTEDLTFAPESDNHQRQAFVTGKWLLMIVDDDPEVHNITKLVLKDFFYEGKNLEIMSAYSATEAKTFIQKYPEIAVILLDVVMEEEDAGLKLVKYIREELDNRLVRIILRTGQPGEAPEGKVIVDYDINDYKEKAELTAQKLFTSIVTSLRSYRDLVIINTSKKGIEKIIESSASIFEIQSMKKFVPGILTQLTAILNLGQTAFYRQTSSIAMAKKSTGFQILAATGQFSSFINQNAIQVLPKSVLEKIEQAQCEKRNIFSTDYLILYFQSLFGAENFIYFEGLRVINEFDIYFTEAFYTNVSIAFDNLFLNQEIESTQKEIIFTLGEIAEARSKETGYHVKRVAEFSKLLALRYGLPEDEAELIRLASPMHDVGKLAIPDAILNKPEKLTLEEFDLIKTHTTIGYDMLKNSHRHIMEVASVIALTHHEKFDGTGYPRGIQGEMIPLYGRITAVADVFDAIGSDRVYKKAWDLEKILDLFRQERGTHFDPMMVDIFFDSLPEILKINETFPDKTFSSS